MDEKINYKNEKSELKNAITIVNNVYDTLKKNPHYSVTPKTTIDAVYQIKEAITKALFQLENLENHTVIIRGQPFDDREITSVLIGDTKYSV